MHHDGVDLAGGRPLAGQIAVVTGAGQGIGRALVEQLVQEGVEAVVAFDRDEEALAALHRSVSAEHAQVDTCVGDVREPGAIGGLVRRVEDRYGRVDVFCSNAGVMAEGGADAHDSVWRRSWEVNVMAHVHAARAVLPAMVARSSGALVHTLSAAGFLSAPESAPYTVTKHAALGFAEWLAINYAHHGITVCAVCPEAVDTKMLRDSLAQSSGSVQQIASAGGVVSPDEVAAAAVRAVKDGRFLVATHPHTLRHAQKKWADVDKWIRAMGSLVSEGKG